MARGEFRLAHSKQGKQNCGQLKRRLNQDKIQEKTKNPQIIKTQKDFHVILQKNRDKRNSFNFQEENVTN